VELNLLEQVVLARNRDQHPENIWTLNVTHSERDLRSHPSPFFIHEDERGLLGDDEDSRMLMSAHLHVSAELLEPQSHRWRDFASGWNINCFEQCTPTIGKPRMPHYRATSSS
jgi:hypothetical protein